MCRATALRSKQFDNSLPPASFHPFRTSDKACDSNQPWPRTSPPASSQLSKNMRMMEYMADNRETNKGQSRRHQFSGCEIDDKWETAQMGKKQQLKIQEGSRVEAALVLTTLKATFEFRVDSRPLGNFPILVGSYGTVSIQDED
jgi:hypothetical protein